MRIDLPWGTGTVTVEVDGRRVAGVLRAYVERAKDPEAILRTATSRPGAGFREFLASAPSPLLVLVNDATRPTPSADVLRVLRADLEEWQGDPGNALAFAIATGTHRNALPEEVEHLLGSDLAEAYADRIVCHDAKDQGRLVHLGRPPAARRSGSTG